MRDEKLLLPIMRMAAVLQKRSRIRQRSGSFGIGLEIGVYVFCDDKPSPHHLVMAGESTKVFTLAFFEGGGELERFALTGLKHLAGGKYFRTARNIKTPFPVELIWFHRGRCKADFFPGFVFYEHQILRPEVR